MNRIALSLFVLGLVVASSLAQTISGSMAFKANVNVTLDSSAQAQFAFRSAVAADLGQGMAFGSFAVSGSGSQNGGSVQADAIFGAGYAILGFPATWLAYYNTNRSLNFNSLSFLTGPLDRTNAGYILTAYTRLIERDPSGNQVAALAMSSALGNLLNINTFTWNKIEGSTTGDVKFVTIRGTDSRRAGFSVLITFAVSSKVGILDYGNTPINPRTLETIIEINGWPYASPSNTLSLEVVAGSGGGSTTATGRLFSSVASSKVYLRVASGVSVDGRDGAVSTSAWADASFDADLPSLGLLKAQAESAIAGAINLKKTEIKFPAGAAKIIYDPTLGQGEPMNSAVGNVVSFVAIVFAAIIAVMFM